MKRSKPAATAVRLWQAAGVLPSARGTVPCDVWDPSNDRDGRDLEGVVAALAGRIVVPLSRGAAAGFRRHLRMRGCTALLQLLEGGAVCLAIGSSIQGTIQDAVPWERGFWGAGAWASGVSVPRPLSPIPPGEYPRFALPGVPGTERRFLGVDSLSPPPALLWGTTASLFLHSSGGWFDGSHKRIH